jgi:putative ABC transport system permease protein
MNFAESAATALNAIRVNKVRSMLTMLGIVIGVFSVVTLVSLVQGVTNYITDQFNSIGSNLILVAPGRFSFGRDPAIAFANNKLSVKDSDDLNAELSKTIVGATPNIRLSKTVEYKEKQFLANVVGSNERILDITNLEIDKGVSFSRNEVESAARVAVIGPRVVKNLFGNADPIDKNINIAGVRFKIIAVTKSKGVQADDRVIVPYTTLQKSLGVKQLSGISIKVRNGVDIDKAMSEVEATLLSNHKKDEFSVLSQKDILKSFENILGMLGIALGAIAGISLLVGGIGIMNIMLVSVNERINEIGLRKALGATSRNIAVQFLLESATLSILGGVVGLSLGTIATVLARPFLRAEIPPWAIVLAVSFSLLVGVIFGTYPAIVASKKDPVEALGYEV